MVGAITANIQTAAHNMGISGDELGHLTAAQSNFISYAYGDPNSGNPFGPTWGQWSTWMSPITVTQNLLPAPPELFAAHAQSGSVSLRFEQVPATSYQVRYGTSPGSYTTTITGVTGGSATVAGLTNGTRYYFVVAATNANGTSVSSAEKSAVPLAYTTATLSAATASSSFNGSWPASNLTDNNNATAWSSINRTASASNEWVRVDTGSAGWIKRVTLTPRQATLHHYPVRFTIEVSQDGTNWVNAYVPSEGPRSGYVLRDGGARQVYEFATAVFGRYVRINASNLAADETWGVYFMQLAGVQVEKATPSFNALVNKGTGKKLHNTAEAYNGQPGSVAENVAAVPSSGVDAQAWVLADLGNGYYRIVNKATGKALQGTNEVYNGNPTARWVAAVTQVPTLQQEWQVVSIGGGYVKIVNRADGRVLHNTGEAYNGNPSFNNVAVVDDNGSDAQRWTIAP